MEWSLKIVKIALAAYLAVPLMAVEHSLIIENTSFILSTISYTQKEWILYNYDRFRLTDNIKGGNWFANIIADIKNDMTTGISIPEGSKETLGLRTSHRIFFQEMMPKMIAYEIQGNVFDTDIEWRSEGCYFKDKPLNKDFYQAILGLDYGFVNGLTVTVSGYTLQKPTFFKKSLCRRCTKWVWKSR